MKLNKKKLTNNLVILLVVLVSIIGIVSFSTTFGIYSSTKDGEAKIDLAYSLIDVNEDVQDINLSDIQPDDKERSIIFTVSNYKGDKIIDINMLYNVTITTTTNLPIEYSLYDENNNKIEITSQTIKDTYNTIFNEIKTQDIRVGYDKKVTNQYKLTYRLDSKYQASSYQDIIELLSIKVSAKQV